MNSKEYHGYTVFEDGTILSKSGKVMSQKCGTYGYKRLNLRINRKKKFHETHRLVAELFIENPEGKRTVNHIDGDKLNNNVSNLEWATHSENNQHAYDMGLRECKRIEE